MPDQEETKPSGRVDPVVTAINEIAETKSGVLFFRWLKNRCFFDRSTIVGNVQTYEVNTIGSISQEFLRRLYLDIRRNLTPEAKKRIEQ